MDAGDERDWSQIKERGRTTDGSMDEVEVLKTIVSTSVDFGEQALLLLLYLFTRRGPSIGLENQNIFLLLAIWGRKTAC